MIFISLAVSLFLTLIIEVPFVCLMKGSWKLAVMVNVLTNPVVVIIYHWVKFMNGPIIMIVIIMEIVAIYVEGVFYKQIHSSPWKISICANLLSFGIGLFL